MAKEQWKEEARARIKARLVELKMEVDGLAIAWTLLELGDPHDAAPVQTAAEKAKWPEEPTPRRRRKVKGKTRTLSAAGRRAIVAAQRKRWAIKKAAAK